MKWVFIPEKNYLLGSINMNENYHSLLKVHTMWAGSLVEFLKYFGIMFCRQFSFKMSIWLLNCWKRQHTTPSWQIYMNKRDNWGESSLMGPCMHEAPLMGLLFPCWIDEILAAVGQEMLLAGTPAWSWRAVTVVVHQAAAVGSFTVAYRAHLPGVDQVCSITQSAFLTNTKSAKVVWEGVLWPLRAKKHMRRGWGPLKGRWFSSESLSRVRDREKGARRNKS